MLQKAPEGAKGRAVVMTGHRGVEMAGGTAGKVCRSYVGLCPALRAKTAREHSAARKLHFTSPWTFCMLQWGLGGFLYIHIVATATCQIDKRQTDDVVFFFPF